MHLANDLATVAAIGGGVAPRVVATLVAAVALVGVVSLRARAGAATWGRAWQLVGFGIAVRATAAAAATHQLLDGTEAATLAGQGLVLAGLLLALRDRTTRGRATDTALEVLLGVGALAFVLATLALDVSQVSRVTIALVALVALVDLTVLWLLARVLEVSVDARPAVRFSVAAATAVLAADTVRGLWLLREAVTAVPAPVTIVLMGALAVWAAGLFHRTLVAPGPALPVSGFDLQLSNLVTLVTPVLLGPIAAIGDLTAGRLRVWVVVGGSFILPLLVVWLLVRQVRLRARREHLAQHDPLTGLPNQRLFLDRVEIELARTRREGGGFAVMFLDLDRFKTVNDSLGHDVGDDLLRAVSRRLLDAVRDGDTVARVGGDEFTVLAPGIANPEEATTLATTIQRRLNGALVVGTRELFTGASIGVAIAPGHGEEADTLLKHADTAMYQAKSGRAGRIHVYTSQLNARARVLLALESELRRAIDEDQLTLHYQPKVRSEDHAVVGHEALVRWVHPRLGLVSPTGFVTLAEETGLIVPLGRWVLRQACRQAGEWYDERGWTGPVAVNISPVQLLETPLDLLVQEALDDSGIHPRLLEIELTESTLLNDLEATAAAIRRIRRLGVTVSLDDFGTGYSGLSYLAQIPVDRLKLDRSFVSTIRPDLPASPVVEAVLGLAEGLKLEVVAEGVETPYQADWLRARGCDTFQGFLFGHPEPAGEATASVPLDVDPYLLNRTVLAVCRGDEVVDPGDLMQTLGLLDDAEDQTPRRTLRRLAGRPA